MTYSEELDELSKQATYWDARDTEIVNCPDVNSAVSEFFDYEREFEVDVTRWPRTLTVRGLNPYTFIDLEVGGIADDVIEQLAEHLDEEHGDPDSRDSRYTKNEKTTELAQAFVASFLENYKPWDCFDVACVEVDVPRWVRECRPEWLGDAAVRAFVEAGE